MTPPPTGTDNGPQDPTPPMRAADADRAVVVRILHDAVARGLLTLEECDERMAAAYAARFVKDLAPLTADLPQTSAPGPTVPGWRPLGAMALHQVRTSVTGVASGGLRSNRRLVLAVVLAVVLVLMVVMLGAVAGHALFEGASGYNGGSDGR